MRSDKLALTVSLTAVLLVLALAWYFQPTGPRLRPPGPARPDTGTATPEAARRRELPVQPFGPPIRIAIVIDDFGFDKALDRRMMLLDVPFTAAIIPSRPGTRPAAELARTRGREVLVHLPMQPTNAKKGEKDAITPAMSDEEVAGRVAAQLDTLPEAVGVNNHTGSLATTDRRLMEAVLQVIDQRGLFFLDSVTSNRSVAAEVARSRGMPTLKRDIFLDEKPDVDYVKRQIDELVRLAREKGSAIGIGHVHAATARALKEKIPALLRQGVDVVPLGYLLISGADGAGAGTARTGAGTP